MITGQGLIGKLLELLATKLLGRKLDLMLDDRKRACRSLVELYFCVEGLEHRTSKLIADLSTGTDVMSRWLALMPFADRGRALDALSQRFLEIGADLERTLRIVDPVLADSLYELYEFKFSFLSFISDSLELKRLNDTPNRLLLYRRPDDRVLSIDMNAYYDWVRENPIDAEIWEKDLEWPKNLLAHADFEQAFPQTGLDLADTAAVEEFINLLKLHASALGKARALLREFLTKNFKIEEVLYVSNASPDSTP